MRFVSVFAVHVSVAVPLVVGGVTVSVTGITCGVLEDPEAETVIAVLYVPATRPEIPTLALTASTSVVVVPLAMFRPSQAAGSVRVQTNVPPAGLLIVNV